MRHVGEVDEIAVLFYRLHTGAAAKDVVRDVSGFDKHLRIAFHRTEVEAAAVGVVAVRH